MKRVIVFLTLLIVPGLIACFYVLVMYPMSLSEMQEIAQWKFSKFCQDMDSCERYEGPYLKDSNDGSATYLWVGNASSESNIVVTVFARGGKSNLYSERKN